MIEYMECVRI